MIKERLTLMEIAARYNDVNVEALAQLILQPRVMAMYEITALDNQTVLGTIHHESLVTLYRSQYWRF